MRASPTLHRWLLIGLVVAHVALGVWYGVAVPLWEAPDEPDHYVYARYLAVERRFPTEMMPILHPDTDEAHQPPIYYIVGALLIPLLGPEPVLIRQNPYFSWGPGPTRNAWVFHNADEWFPYQEWVLSAHWMRVLSALFDALAIWAVWRLCLVVFPERPWLALGAAALNALRPGLLATSGSISNDATVAAFGTITFLLLARMWRDGVTAGRSLAVGTALGLTLVSKENALAIVPAVGLWPVWLTWRRYGPAGWRAAIGPVLATGLIVGLTTAVVGGWWFARNMVLHGAPIQRELSGFSEMPLSALSPLRVVEAAAMYNATWWGSFGWQLLFLPTSWNVVLGAFLLFMLVGIGPALWRERGSSRLETLLWLLAAGLLVFAVTEFRRQLSPQPGRDHARYWLPAIGPISLLLWLGMIDLAGRLRLRWLPAAAVGGLAVLSVATVPLVIAPNFPEPVPVRPSIARWQPQHPAAADFGGAVRLAGYDAPASATPGGTLALDLYWEILAPTRVDHTVFVHLVDAGGEKRAQGDGPIGTFEYGTTRLLPGEAVRSRHALALPTDLAAGRYTVVVGVYPTGAALERLPVSATAFGVAQSAVRLAAVDVAGARASEPRAVVYGGALKLAGVRLAPAAPVGAPLEVDLEWEMLAPVDREYKVFVHLVDEADQPRAQSDGPLEIVDYPVVRWRPGEQLRTRRSLPLDGSFRPGQYRLLVGLYDPAQPSQRLSILSSDVPTANHAARVAQVEIRP
jgi:hypothetical protein